MMMFDKNMKPMIYSPNSERDYFLQETRKDL